jgi:hypothetical protein
MLWELFRVSSGDFVQLLWCDENVVREACTSLENLLESEIDYRPARSERCL